MGCQIFVGTTEMTVAKKSVVGRKWRRVGRSKHQVATAVDECPLLLCISSPQKKYQIFTPLSQAAYGGIGKLFPPLTLVGTCLMGTYRECGIEQQHSLLCPTGEIARKGERHTQIILQFLEDIDQRGRELYPIVDREAESVRLPRTMIGVLPDDDHLHPVKRTEVESIENQPSGGIYGCNRIFAAHKVGEPHKIGLFKLVSQLLFPALFYLYIHRRKNQYQSMLLL